MKIEKANVNKDLINKKLNELEAEYEGKLEKKTDFHTQLKLKGLVINIYCDKKNNYNVSLDDKKEKERQFIEIFKNIFDVCSTEYEEELNYQLSFDKKFFLEKKSKFCNDFKIEEKLFDNNKPVKINNEVTITIYPKKILFQGKYKQQYHDIVAWLEDNISKDLNISRLFLDENKEKIFLKEQKDDNFWISKLKERMPKSKDYFNGKLMAIMSSSMIIFHEQINCPDYSLFSNPVLRGIEGYIKKISKIEESIENGIISKKMSELFEQTYPNSGVYRIKPMIKNIFKKNEVLALEKAFNFYQKHRHEYVHIDNSIETSKIIKDKEKCKELITQALLMIENTYCEEFQNE